MDIYIERKNGITLEEWLDFVSKDDDLVLSECSEGINPITKQKLLIKIPGRVLYGDTEIIYQNGHIGCYDYSEEALVKLKEIANSFNAEIIE